MIQFLKLKKEMEAEEEEEEEEEEKKKIQRGMNQCGSGGRVTQCWRLVNYRRRSLTRFLTYLFVSALAIGFGAKQKDGDSAVN